MMEATVLNGTIKAAEMFLPQICARYNPIPVVYRQLHGLPGFVCAWLHCQLHRDRCVPFQIMSIWLNLPHVDSSQVVETSDGWSVETWCTWSQPHLLTVILMIVVTGSLFNRVAELQSTLDCWVTCIAVHALYLSKMTRGIFAWLKVTISNLRSVYQRCSGASCIWLPVLLVFCTKWCNNEGGLALNSSASPLPKCPAEVQFGKLNQMSAAIYETNKRLNNMCWCWPWLQLPEKEENSKGLSYHIKY